MNAEARAAVLAARRDQLVAQATRIPGGERVPHHDRELAVDQAITYVVMECPEALPTTGDVERVVWAALKYRISDAARGRNSTVRNGWKRADESALETATSKTDDPVEAAEDAEAWAVVHEVVQMLAPREQRVLRVKYFSGTTEPLGYKRIAERLNLTLAEARAADRAIRRKIERFAAIYTSGRLCPERATDIAALAEGAADPHQAKIATAHVTHCTHCRNLYAEQVRAFRSATFERKVASILPAVEATDRHRLRGAWDAVTDTLSRPFTRDATSTALQLSSSGVGRGLGAALTAKVVGACLASVTALSVCATVALHFREHHPTTAKREVRSHPKTTATATPTPIPVRRRERPFTQARARATPVPTATPRPTRSRLTQGGTSATSHEQTPASPAPANAAADGSSEFDPLYQPSEPAQPAPVPAAPGSSEFF